MKKLVAIVSILLVIVSFSMFAAGKSEGTPKSGNVKKLTIANVPKFTGGAWFNRMKVGVERFAKETGHDAFQIGADRGDAALQVKEIENLIAQGITAINVVPVAYEPLEPVLKRAMERGIIVISHEAQGIKNVHYNVEPFIGEEYGAHLGEQLAKAMGGTGEYIIAVGSLSAASHMQWANGLLRHIKAKYPNMKCLNETQFLETLYNAKASKERVAELLITYPNLKGIFCASATDLTGMALGIEEARAQNRVHLVGNGMPNANKDYVKSGAISFLGCWDPAETAYVMGLVTEIVWKGGSVKSGDNLKRPGYENVRVIGNNIIGQAWIDLTKDVIDKYNF